MVTFTTTLFMDIKKKQRIRDDSIKIIGTCSQCNANIDIKSNKITDQFASFFCKVSNFDKAFKHSIAKKSKLTPFSRRQIGQELRYKSSMMVRNELTAKLVPKLR